MTLNHILSQINFKAKNTNKRLTYRIAAVRIVHAANSDSYTCNPGTAAGLWTGTTSGNKTFELNFKDDPITLDGTDGKTEVFLTHEGHGAMLVPQMLTPWNGEEVSDAAPFDNGSYIALLVNVQFTGNSFVYPKKADGATDYGWIAIPLPKNNAGKDKAEWKVGNKYIYTLNLSEGCGKVAPESPNPEGGKVDPTGQPNTDPKPGANIFGKPIKFTVQVAPWTTDGNDTNIQM